MKQSKILVVEDDENIRTLYVTALETAGLNVHAVGTGAEGVTYALKEHPSVILMDIMLPDISGHEAVEKIRNDRWGKDAKIIFLTNMSDASDVAQAVAAGSEEYIIKVHTTPHEVVNIVRTASNVD